MSYAEKVRALKKELQPMALKSAAISTSVEKSAVGGYVLRVRVYRVTDEDAADLEHEIRVAVQKIVDRHADIHI